MAPEAQVDDKGVATVNVDGSVKSAVGLTIDEGKVAVKPVDGPTAESLKVTEDQFVKYFKDGKYDWESHAREAEFKGEKKPAEAVVTKPVTPIDPKGDDEARSLAENAGLDWDVLRDKIADTGDLDDADYAALKKIGVPESIARDHIAAIHEVAETHYNKIVGMFGDAAGLKAVVDKLVANETYTDADRQILSEKLSDPREAVITANLLLQQAGQKVQTFRGTNQSTPSELDAAKAYGTESEFVAAIRDPRYKKDVTYRAEVTARAAASTFDQNVRRHTGGL